MAGLARDEVKGKQKGREKVGNFGRGTWKKRRTVKEVKLKDINDRRNVEKGERILRGTMNGRNCETVEKGEGTRESDGREGVKQDETGGVVCGREGGREGRGVGPPAAR